MTKKRAARIRKVEGSPYAGISLSCERSENRGTRAVAADRQSHSQAAARFQPNCFWSGATNTLHAYSVPRATFIESPPASRQHRLIPCLCISYIILISMPKFLIEATYTAEGYKGLSKDKPSGRKAAIAQAVRKLGGNLDAAYFCLGENDVVLIVDLPDHLAAAALGSAACASGMARTKTTVLLTVEEADQALSKPTDYRAPGA